MSLNLNFEIDRHRLRKRRGTSPDMVFLIRLTALVLLLLIVSMLSGCTSTNQTSHAVWKNPFKKKDKPQMAGAVTTIWENVYFPATGMRGLRGHLLFFSDTSLKKNIRVDGMVSVYVFDDSVKDVEGLEPIRIYRFNPDTVPLHEVKTDLGYTYVFWLPFDEVGGEEMSLTLLTRFDGVKGDRPEPAQTSILLTGTPKKKLESQGFPPMSDIMQVGYTSQTGSQNLPTAPTQPQRPPAPVYDLTPALAKQIFNTTQIANDLPENLLASNQRIVSRSVYDEGYGRGDEPSQYQGPGNSFSDPQVGRAFVNVREQMQQRMQDWNQVPQNAAQFAHSYQSIQQVTHQQPVEQRSMQQPMMQQFAPQQVPTSMPTSQGNYQPQRRMDISNNQTSFTQEMLQPQGLTKVPANDPGLIQSPGTHMFLGQPGAAGFNPPMGSF